jgi:hypothetical protein
MVINAANFCKNIRIIFLTSCIQLKLYDWNNNFWANYLILYKTSYKRHSFLYKFNFEIFSLKYQNINILCKKVIIIKDNSNWDKLILDPLFVLNEKVALYHWL